MNALSKFSIGIFVLPLLLLSDNLLMSKSRMEEIIDKNNKRQKYIIENNLKKQKEILAKFDKFFEKFKKYAPGLDLKPPISVKYARDVKKLPYKDSMIKKKPKYAYISENYRLKSKPLDTSKKIIKKVKKGVRVEVLMSLTSKRGPGNFTKDWVLIKLKDGTEGYIPLNMLSSGNPRKRSSLRSEGHYFTLGYFIEEDQQPFEYYQGRGNTDQDIEDYNNYFIKMVQYYRRGRGKYRKVDSVSMKITARPYLNIRREADRYSQKLGRAFHGEVVKVIGFSHKKETIDRQYKPWAKITCQGITGWVFSGYLKSLKSSSGSKSERLKKGDRIYVKSALLRVRDEPGEEGSVITSISHQKRVKIIDINDEVETIGKIRSRWVEISFDEFTGWVFGGFLSRDKHAFIDDDKIDKQYLWPLDSYRNVSSKYGYRVNPTSRKKRKGFHNGIDIPAPRGALIQAAANGFIIRREYSRGYGNVIIIEHGDGNRTLYAHMSRFIAKNSVRVKTGQNIGRVGTTGRSTGPHLHFEVRTNEGFTNPANYVHP